jgi:hypothetical protein
MMPSFAAKVGRLGVAVRETGEPDSDLGKILKSHRMHFAAAPRCLDIVTGPTRKGGHSCG